MKGEFSLLHKDPAGASSTKASPHITNCKVIVSQMELVYLELCPVQEEVKSTRAF